MEIRDNVNKTVDAPSAETPTKSNTARIVSLVIGDILVFLIFAAIGRRSHGEASGLSSILQIVLTAAPFAIGWFLVSPWVGAYKRGLEKQPKKMAARTALSWFASWPVGLALRGIFVDHGVPPWTFALITLVVNMVFLLVWRVPFSLVNKNRQAR